MSRSYKKTPWSGDKKGKNKKRIANSKVRVFLKNFNHKLQNADYKKVYETWDICDFGWIYSWKKYWNHILKNYIDHPEWYKNPLNKKEEYRKWYKMYKMK